MHPFVCGRTLGTDKQILAQLKGVKESDLWDCQLILAFSPVTSRAGTDTEEALKKIPGNYLLEQCLTSFHIISEYCICKKCSQFNTGFLETSYGYRTGLQTFAPNCTCILDNLNDNSNVKIFLIYVFTVDKPAVLVTMHHTFSPTHVCPSLKIASSQGNIVEHVNVLFHDSHHGLLRCPANENAMTKLQSVLNRYM